MCIHYDNILLFGDAAPPPAGKFLGILLRIYLMSMEMTMAIVRDFSASVSINITPCAQCLMCSWTLKNTKDY